MMRLSLLPLTGLIPLSFWADTLGAAVVVSVAHGDTITILESEKS
jgi:hypothetical protein